MADLHRVLADFFAVFEGNSAVGGSSHLLSKGQEIATKTKDLVYLVLLDFLRDSYDSEKLRIDTIMYRVRNFPGLFHRMDYDSVNTFFNYFITLTS